ncbi:MAG: hypothetical protein ACRCZD_12755 [Phycicoccus sp.]
MTDYVHLDQRDPDPAEQTVPDAPPMPHEHHDYDTDSPAEER